MYSLIIVDDEQDVREAVISTIDWESLGFRIVAEAENGREAFDLVERLNPDVLITDIKMPYMDGIELVRTVRETNPAVKIVMLTGFSEFEYAKSAIKYNIIEYMLKPISAQSMTETLQTIRKKLDDEREESSNLERLKSSYMESLPIIREGFLVSLVTSSQPLSGLRQQINKLGLKLTGCSNLVFTVDISSEGLAGSSFATDDVIMVLESVLNLVKRIVEKYMMAECFRCGEKITVILSGSRAEIERYSSILMREISQSAEKSMGLRIVIGSSGRFDEFMQVQQAYHDSLAALNYRFAAGEDNIICIDDLEPGRRAAFRLPESLTLELDALLKTGSSAEIGRFINSLFEQLLREKATAADYRLCIFEIASVAVRATRVLNDPAEEAQGLSLIGELYNNKSVDEIRQKLKSQCTRLNEQISQQRQKNASIIIDQAWAYIRANYADANASVKSASQHLHVSPNYLSALFKKGTGDSLINALISVRMEKARELVQSTGMKVLEIAGHTGYTDQHYFSYCFKKHFGLSPNEMRSNLNTGRL